MKVSKLFSLILICFLFSLRILSYPVFAADKEIKVLDITYVPLLDTNTGVIDHTVVGDSLKDKLAVDLLSRLDFVGIRLAEDLTKSTKYHGYSKPENSSYIKFSVYKKIRYFESLPIGIRYYKQDPNEIVYRPDYIKVLERENICDYVDNKGVREVWLWGYHFGKIEPAESNMSMGLNDKLYWNRSGYGDYSNSESTNDLPVCSNTYVLYNYRYDMSYSTYRPLHNHIHQLEILLIALSGTKQETLYPKNFFINRFVGYSENQLFGRPIDYPYCGTAHWTSNGTKPITSTSPGDHYNFSSLDYKDSNCENWDPEVINLAPINCKNWAGDNCGVDKDEDGRRYHMWWMQSLAGKGNKAFYNGYKVMNWWDAYLDFGEVRRKGEQMISKYKVDYTADRLVNRDDYQIVVNDLFERNGVRGKETLSLLFYMINIEHNYFK